MSEPRLLTPDWQVPAPVQAFVVTRQGGVSHPPFDACNLACHVGDQETLVQLNREAVRRRLPGSPELQWLQQVHGADAVRVSVCGQAPRADALVTAVPSLGLCVLTADCLPVFFSDCSGSEVALAHAGWRGLAGGVLENTVAQLAAAPAQLQVWLGPAIGPCHFEVGEDVHAAFQARHPGARSDNCFRPARESGKYLADLYALARLELQQLGIGRVSGGGFCTVCDADNFYSYRRDGRTGRNLSVIYIKAA